MSNGKLKMSKETYNARINDVRPHPQCFLIEGNHTFRLLLYTFVVFVSD